MQASDLTVKETIDEEDRFLIYDGNAAKLRTVTRMGLQDFIDSRIDATSITEDETIALINSMAISGMPDGYVGLNNGIWAGGFVFTSRLQFMAYKGISYIPKPETTLPYGPTGLTPDTNFVQPYSELSPLDLGDYTDYVFDLVSSATASENLSVGDYATIIERGNSVWEVVSGEIANGFDIIGHDSLPIQLSLTTKSNGNVIEFGATGDGVSNDTDNILAAHLAGDFVTFPRGSYVVDSISFTKQLQFNPGSKLLSASGSNIEIFSVVNSTNQFIFDGDGDYNIGDASSPFARMVHASWFGAIPDEVSQSDVAPNFQKMFDSLGTSRESYIKLDIGTYYVYSGMTTGRAVKFFGAGDRLTNIWVKFSSGDVFTTGGDGCNFHNLQFNADAKRTGGSYINLSSNRCETYDIYMDKGFIGISQNGSESKSYRTKGLTWSEDAGTSVIAIRNADCVVDEVDYTQSQNLGPEHVVHIDTSTGGVARARINNIRARTGGHLVGGKCVTGAVIDEPLITNLHLRSGKNAVNLIVEGTSSPNTIQISEVIAGSGADAAVVIESTSGGVFGVIIDDISGNSCNEDVIRITNNGSGFIRPVIIGQHDLRGRNGLLINGTGNPVERVSIGSGCARNNSQYGYDMLVKYIAATGGLNGISNSSGDLVLRNGSDSIRVSHNCVFVTDETGAVNKVIENNL